MPPGGAVGADDGLAGDEDGLLLAEARGDELEVALGELPGDDFADDEHATSTIARSRIAIRRVVTGGSLVQAVDPAVDAPH